ncbi:MAG: peptidase glycoprotease [Candidatus Berkelbacteria bacterium]|nr:peptidase glycoprotease [Candidatus Berkelbacteria bacterium]
MILHIDTINNNCQVALYDGKNSDILKWQWKTDTGSEVLKNIQELLKKHKKNLIDIKAIIVNQGPGSYTGTRVGIVIANTLGWSLNIPVFGYSNQKPETVARKICQKLSKGQLFPDHFPTPIY